MKSGEERLKQPQGPRAISNTSVSGDRADPASVDTEKRLQTRALKDRNLRENKSSTT